MQIILSNALIGHHAQLMYMINNRTRVEEFAVITIAGQGPPIDVHSIYPFKETRRPGSMN